MKKVKKQVLLILLVSLILSICPCFAKEVSTFTDILPGAWYYDSVGYVFDKGLMNGTGETTFAPESSITRGMIVTIIHRMEGSPETTVKANYSDVSKEYYYYSPIMWATEKGIVNGYSADVFAPNNKITREQFATILYRYAAYKDLDVSFDDSVVKQLENYTDSNSISKYANDAMSWTNGSKLITGTTTSTLEPQGTATRAQAATIFMRFDKWMTEVKNEVSDGDKTPEDSKPITPSKPVTPSKPDEPQIPDEPKVEEETLPQGLYLKVNDAEVTSGDTVEVKVSLENNPGIMGLMVSFEYDDSAMKLTKVINGDVLDDNGGYVFTAPKNMASGCRASWYTLEDEFVTASGTVVTLVFEISKSAEKGSYPVSIQFDPVDVIDKNDKELALKVINGSIILK